jgi:hypothetical protein
MYGRSRGMDSKYGCLEMENGKRAKNMIKKLKLAADVGRFSDMRLKISSHREQLALLVELLTMYSIISYIVDWRANDNRDLEMSTSLDLRAIDSKVDNFTTKQTSSQQITDSHFEKIQERVQIFQTLQHTTHEATLEVSRSTDKIHQTLHDIRVSQASSQQATHLQADRLDATLATIQRSLLNMAHSAHSRPRSRRTGRKMRHSRPIMESESEDCGDSSMQGVFSELVQRTPEPAIIPSQLNRLVDLVVTVRYRCGKAHFEALAIPDLEFEAAGVETKLRMIKYLQDLQLLLWLLYRKEHVCKGSFEFARFSRSEFISEAGLVSSWTLWTILDIAGVVPAENICTDEHYLEYLSKRMSTVSKDELAQRKLSDAVQFIVNNLLLSLYFDRLRPKCKIGVRDLRREGALGSILRILSPHPEIVEEGRRRHRWFRGARST